MIIIDGHNLLHAIYKLSRQPHPLSEFQLCRLIDRFLKLTRRKGQIVFDGTGPPDKDKFYNMSNLEVCFAGFSDDADSIIEDKIKANTAPKRLTVVSSDRRLRRATQARKATITKSEDFWNLLHRQLSKKRPPKEPLAKRIGLTDSETERWLEFFELNQ